MSLKIHLIFSPTLKIDKGGSIGAETIPPFGILFIASFLRKTIADIEIKITNGLLVGMEKTLSEIKAYPSDICGLSFQSSNALGAYEISKIIKRECPKKLIVMGGVHSTIMPEDVLQFSHADLVCIGEGEVTFSEIVKNFLKYKKDTNKTNFSDVSGIVFKHKGNIIQTPSRSIIENLDDIPFPSWDLIDISQYAGGHIVLSKKRPSIGVMFSRGCTFNCSFCANEMWKQHKPYMRRRSPNHCFDEVELLIKKYNIKEYVDKGNDFNTDLEHALEMCHTKIKRNIDTFWFTQLRAYPMTDALAKIMKDANCWGISIGVESANKETLIGIKKNITLSQFEKSCEILKKHGIKVLANFMFLNAWEHNNELHYENIEKSQNTLNYAKHLLRDNLIDYFTWSQATPYPGSDLYRIAIKYNLIKDGYGKNWDEWNHSWDFVMKLPGINVKDCQRLKNMGTLLQAKALLSNIDNINISSGKFILKKATYFMGNLLKHGVFPKKA